MINPAAVEEFLARTGLADSRKAKEFTDEELDARLAMLDPPAVFDTPPRKHQKVSFLLSVKYPSGYAHWHEQGGGKSWVALNYVKWHIAAGTFQRAVALVPYGTLVSEWAERESKKHTPGLRVAAIQGSRAEREELFWRADIDLAVVTYAGFLALLCDRSGGDKMTPNHDLVQQAAERYGAAILDESTYVSNHQSLSFKVLKLMRKCGLGHVQELTGTPFGDDPHLLWAQFYLLDQGETLGPTLGLFRAVFFRTERNFWGGWKHHFKKSMWPVLHRIVAHRSIRYESEEFDDLPPMTGGIVSGTGLLTREVEMSAEARAYYQNVSAELKEAKGNFRETENVWHRMRRLSSGYALPKDDEGEAHPLLFSSNPKLDALLELLTEIPLGRQVLVFCIYRFTGELLVKALKAAHYRVGRLYGAQGAKAQSQVITDYLEGKTHVLVASETAAYGLNLQVGNYCIFYESPVAPIVRRQMEKRLHRGDQKHKVFVYDLVVKGTVDEKILRSLEAGQDLFNAVVNGASYD